MCHLWWALTVFNGMGKGDRGKSQHKIPPDKSRSCSVLRTTPGNQRGSQKQTGAGTGRQQQARSPPASHHSCCGRRELLIHHQPAPTSHNRRGTTHTHGRQAGNNLPRSGEAATYRRRLLTELSSELTWESPAAQKWRFHLWGDYGHFWWRYRNIQRWGQAPCSRFLCRPLWGWGDRHGDVKNTLTLDKKPAAPTGWINY